MAIEAPLSRSKRNNALLGVAACVGLALWCGYDGYFSEAFRQNHPEWWRTNRVAPFVLLPAAAAFGVWSCAVRNRKLVADDSELVIAGKSRIPYEAIEQIDRTHFERKGFFVIIYKQAGGAQTRRRLSDRDYDNLSAILDHLIAKIT